MAEHGKLHDLGQESMAVEAMPAQPKEKSKYYPTLYLDGDQMPHLDDYDVGEEVALHFVGVIKRKSESDGEEGHKSSVDVELRKGSCVSM